MCRWRNRDISRPRALGGGRDVRDAARDNKGFRDIARVAQEGSRGKGFSGLSREVWNTPCVRDYCRLAAKQGRLAARGLYYTLHTTKFLPLAGALPQGGQFMSFLDALCCCFTIKTHVSSPVASRAFDEQGIESGRSLMYHRGLTMASPPPLWIVHSRTSDTARRCAVYILSGSRQQQRSGESVYSGTVSSYDLFDPSRLSHYGRRGVVFILSPTDVLYLQLWLQGMVDGGAADRVPFQGLSFGLFCVTDSGNELGLEGIEEAVALLGGRVSMAWGDLRGSLENWSAMFLASLCTGGGASTVSPLLRYSPMRGGGVPPRSPGGFH